MPQQSAISMAIAVRPEAASAGRYDLLEAEPDGWLSLAHSAKLEREGAPIERGVLVADPGAPDAPSITGELMEFRGGYVVAVRQEGEEQKR